VKRLFFALWPDDATRQHIDVENQRIPLTGVRKLKPSNLHVTLVFLGNVDAAMTAAMVERVSLIQAKAFSFQLDGIEHWHTPKTLCLTVSQQPQALHDLVEQLVTIVADYPIHQHDRPYRAHVTLMRKAKSEYPLTFNPIEWQARDFVLVESRSTEQGIQYDVLARWPLMK
jgi:2'-5' RNA ligase